MILRLFLFFSRFEPGDSYKKYSYKKKACISTGSHYSVSGATVEKAEHNIRVHVITIFQPSLVSD